MCIAIFSTAHPDYALIVINNRDEYLNRPTKPADWWEAPHTNVLGGRDLLRAEQGTWLGITRQGRIAVLTNFREEGDIALEARSRGAMVNAFLKQPRENDQSTEDFVKALVEGEGLKGIGGFSLVCGKVGEPLAVISNRTPDVNGITWIARERGETIGLSNAAIVDRSWAKVTRGEELVKEAIRDNVASGGRMEGLVQDLFRVLQDDTLPRGEKGIDWRSQVRELRKSIFIPILGGEKNQEDRAQDLPAAESHGAESVEQPEMKKAPGDGLSGAYGTQKQTIVLVSHQGRVTFIERTLYDAEWESTKHPQRDKAFEFAVEK